jgi:hypothetical protein
VPADAGVDDGRAAARDGLAELDDLVPAAAFGNQVDHRQAKDDDEVVADGFACALHDLHRQAHAVAVVAAPGVGAAIGFCGEELVDEIAFRAHDLDAVVTRLARLAGAIHVPDLALHPAADSANGVTAKW